jgi:hypothetical protein
MKEKDVIKFLTQIIDAGKLENLITNLNCEKVGKEATKKPLVQRTGNSKNHTALQKKQSRYNVISEKFRVKYGKF